MQLLLLLIGLFYWASPNRFAAAEVPPLLNADLQKILNKAKLPIESVRFDVVSAQTNEVEFRCSAGNSISMLVRATNNEKTSTFYYGLHRLGFKFPHPRMQLSPRLEDMRRQCSRRYAWKPSLPQRGFDLQNRYPNEWLVGLYEGDRQIIDEIIYWMSRNFQNTLIFHLLDKTRPSHLQNISYAIKLAHQLQIRVGLNTSLTPGIEKRFSLVGMWRFLTGLGAEQSLIRNANRTIILLDPDFVILELGALDLNTLSLKRTLRWVNTLSDELSKQKKFLLPEVHAKNVWTSENYGNLNFILRQTNRSIPALVSTVLPFHLTENSAPVYNRKSYQDLYRFIMLEKPKRAIWLHPQTAYFPGMDTEIPLFLTDYLRARSRDYQFAVETGLAGHIAATVGHELGHWLIDWNVALQANSEYLGMETIGPQLLGENVEAWKNLIAFQTEYIKKSDLLGVISTTSLFDEIHLLPSVYNRVQLSSLFNRETFLLAEIQSLQKAIDHAPRATNIQNHELASLVQITWLRLQHALYLRKAIIDRNDKSKKFAWLNHAKKVREIALSIMATLVKEHSRYPEAHLFERFANTTSYKFGYGWPARTLYFWEREEKIVEKQVRNPFFMNVYDPLQIIF